MSWVEDLRADMLKRGHKVTATAVFIKAIATAQLKHPDSRRIMLPWGEMVTVNEIVAGFTVEKIVEGEPVVFLGTIKDPQHKSLEEIAGELKQHVDSDITDIPQLAIEQRFSRMPWLVRRLILCLGNVFPTIRLRFMPATFGLTSLGKFGISTGVPVCVCTSTFAVGSLEQRPVVREGEVRIRPMVHIILNCDHRVIDGAPAARFLNDVRLLLEGGLAQHVEDGTEKVELLP
jgi:pyruvate/2-oxoglutarate dehydrogenase complex dihydrolipoamide acyltransferase (E2) component